tara:strand:+ start:6004 stop:7905 length:1902 start_codon:yes stop_codon:yes gene_type:complete
MFGQQPLFAPNSNWIAPNHFPDLSQCKEIALDVETCDPGLTDRGPGYLFQQGYVCGFSIDTDTGVHGYWPIQHLEGNLDYGLTCSWISDQSKKLRPDCDIVLANGQYDLGWMKTIGADFTKQRIIDIQIIEALLDEERSGGYALDSLALSYLGTGKNETLLRNAAAAWNINPKSELWKLPARFVGPYGEGDAVKTRAIWQQQKPQLDLQDLWNVAQLEMRLTPILLKMTEVGLNIDQDYATKLNETWITREKQLRQKRGNLDIWSSAELGKLLVAEGFKVPLTAKTKKLSVDKNYLTKLSGESSLAREILELRGLSRTREVYLEKNMLVDLHRGRVHPQYVQIARDDGGTRTGRLSSKQPNFQQIPKRNPLFNAKLIRHAVIPDHKDQYWIKSDYRSQEIVIQVHYGLVLGFKGAEEVAEAIKRGEKLYHYIENATQGRITYDQAKAVVLGRSYGMGKAKMSYDLNISEDECETILTEFDDTVPFIKLTDAKVQGLARRNGYIKGLLGRRRHFHQWEPKVPFDQRRDFEKKYGSPEPMTRKECEEKFPDYMPIRAQTRKAYNALNQGGGATQTKMAMVDTYNAGHLPRLQVHDEINYLGNNETDPKEIAHLMENTITLKLPVTVDLEIGKHWV